MPPATAEKLKAFGHIEGKPVLASWMGGDEVAAGEAILNRADIPTFAYPGHRRARVHLHVAVFARTSARSTKRPCPPPTPPTSNPAAPRPTALIEAVKKTGRTILTEAESKELLGCYGIPTVVTKIAKTEADAAKLAKEIGFPSVLKLYSETITHKTDVGGVQLNLKDEADVRRAFKAIKTAVHREEGRRAFPGRHRPEDDQAGRRLRNHPGQQH